MDIKNNFLPPAKFRRLFTFMLRTYFSNSMTWGNVILCILRDRLEVSSQQEVFFCQFPLTLFCIVLHFLHNPYMSTSILLFVLSLALKEKISQEVKCLKVTSNWPKLTLLGQCKKWFFVFLILKLDISIWRPVVWDNVTFCWSIALASVCFLLWQTFPPYFQNKLFLIFIQAWGEEITEWKCQAGYII